MPRVVRVGIALLWLIAAAASTASGQETSPATAADDAGEVAGASRAAGSVLTVTAEPREIHVGDPVRIRVTLTRAEGSTVALPPLSGTLGEFEILAVGEPTETSGPGGETIQEVEATITAWRTGALEIPMIAAGAGGPGEVRSEPIPIAVTSVGIESSKDIRPIKEPLSLPRDWRPLLLAALAAIIIALVAYFLWRRLRKRPGAAAPAPIVDARPPHEIALAELERLAALGLVERGRVVEHYVRLTEILRAYFAARYGIPALDMTTSEILEALRKPLDRAGIRRSIEAYGEITSLLHDADLVKFAEFVPDRTDALATVDRASRVVIATREEEAPPLAAAS